MSTSEKPAIVLVHGAWHIPAHYQGFIDALTNAGFETHCPLLPTCNGAQPANSTLEDDTNTIEALIRSLIDKGRQVLLLMHSYAGVVGTNAVNQNLSFTQRKRNGLPSGVIALVYLCAFMLQPGETVKSATHVPASDDPVVVAADGTSTVKNSQRMFYHDLNEADANKCASMLVPHSIAAFVEPVTETSWRELPVTYLYCTEDRVLWYDWQVEQVRAMREQGGDVRTETFRASHSPYLSMPGEVVEAIQRASAAAVSGTSG